LNADQIRAKRLELVEKYGEWTAHNIHLGDGVYTYDANDSRFDNSIQGYMKVLRRMLQVASDLTNQRPNQLRVLDLACLEGIYAIEFALHGAEVVGVEIREANVEKARFAKDALNLRNVTFVQDDVRNLSVEKYGQFDVVLCIGILYHLDVPDAIHLVEKICDVCTRLAIIDTHVGLNQARTFAYQGHEYHGWGYTEHAEDATAEQKTKALHSSIDNPKSFWFTRPSLYNLLADIGFTSAYECQMPATPPQFGDRDTIVALKGQLAETDILSFSTRAGIAPTRWPEEFRIAAVQ